MVIFVAVKLKKLFKKKRNYSWPKPESCPRCNDYKLWGHGYAQAIFDGYNEPLLLSANFAIKAYPLLINIEG